MKLLSLFSGIGAFEKALTNLGVEYELVGFSEIDKWAIESYSAVHGVSTDLNLGDVSRITAKEIDNDIDIITHGSPCQDYSVAGKGKGGDKGSGTRSSLMWETVRIIGYVYPKYVIWENVKGVLSKKNKHNFKQYLNDLTALGYTNYYKVLNAKDYGIPQNRERIFIVSIRKDLADNTFKFPEPQELELTLRDMLDDEVEDKYYINNPEVLKLIDTHKKQIVELPTICERRRDEGLRFFKDNLCGTIRTIDSGGDKRVIEAVKVREATKKGYDIATENDSINISFPKSKTRRGRVGKGVAQTLDTQCNQAVLQDYKIRKLTPLECWRLMGFEDKDYWKARRRLEEVFYNGNDRSNSQMYKQAGNSIVVNVLEEIFKELFKIK